MPQRSLSWAFLVGLVVALGVPPFAGLAQEAPPPALLLPSDSSPRAQVADATVLRRRTTRIDVSAVATANGPTRGRRVTLNLFDDVSPVAVIDLAGPASAGRATWTGKVEGDPVSSVTIALHDDALSASIITAGASYQIEPTGSGLHEVERLDPSAFPPERAPLRVPESEQRAMQTGGVGALADDGSTIDALVVYTAQARAAVGGTAEMNSQIDLAVANTNLAYANSGVAQRMRLVHAEEVSYAETGDVSSDLSVLTTPNDGVLDSVQALRDTYAADVVSMIVETGGQTACGVAYLMDPLSAGFAPYAFSVVVRSCAVGNLSFAHETAHNMGANHDRGVVSGASPTEYNFGYVAPSKAWRTVMAYPTTCNCPRLPYFSNPSVTLNGEAMGVAGGSSNAADNHRILNESATFVANFRASAPSATTTPTSTATPTRTSVPTLTATGTSTSTATATATPTRTVTPTATVGLAALNGTVSLQGLAAGTTAYQVALDVRLFQPGTNNQVASFPSTTDVNGAFTVAGIAPGTYDVEVKEGRRLGRVARSLTLAAGVNTKTFGDLPAGDTNGDDAVTLVDYSRMRASYGKCQGDPAYQPSADFNGDGCITLPDYSRLRANYGMAGPLPAP